MPLAHPLLRHLGSELAALMEAGLWGAPSQDGGLQVPKGAAYSQGPMTSGAGDRRTQGSDGGVGTRDPLPISQRVISPWAAWKKPGYPGRWRSGYIQSVLRGTTFHRIT